jgi:hypothetical protein
MKHIHHETTASTEHEGTKMKTTVEGMQQYNIAWTEPSMSTYIICTHHETTAGILAHHETRTRKTTVHQKVNTRAWTEESTMKQQHYVVDIPIKYPPS